MLTCQLGLKLEGKWEDAMADLYYPVHSMIQNLLEPAEFWVRDRDTVLPVLYCAGNAFI